MKLTVANVALLSIIGLLLATLSCGSGRPPDEPEKTPTPTPTPTTAAKPTGAPGKVAGDDAEPDGTPRSEEPVLADWPAMGDDENTALATGIVNQIIGAMPPTLNVTDSMIQPGETARLTIKLGRGFGRTTFKSFAGAPIIITDSEGNEVLRTPTDGSGVVSFEEQFDRAGNYFFRVRTDGSVDDQKVQPALFCVYVRPKDSPLAICDLDKTLVRSGFGQVMLGMAWPFEHASDVLWRLVKERDMSVVYLTHRPDFFLSSSRTWLRENGFPPGPLLTSDLAGLFSGSGTFKAGEIAGLKERFPNLRLAVGDKYSDVEAYVENDVPSILIPDIDWKEEKRGYWEEELAKMKGVDPGVSVCRNWYEIEDVLFRDGSFPPGQMVEKIEEKINAAKGVD